MVTAASHTPAGILVRLPRSPLLPSSCLPPLPLSTLPPRAVTLTLRSAVAFSVVSPRRLPRCWSLRSSSCLSVLFSEMLYVLEGFCVCAGVYWCVDCDFAIFCSCGSCMWSAASSSSLCAYVGCFFSPEGIQFWLDGILAFAFVALFLVGVYFVCCRGSSCK